MFGLCEQVCGGLRRQLDELDACCREGRPMSATACVAPGSSRTPVADDPLAA